MKRADLIRKLEEKGGLLVRHGGRTTGKASAEMPSSACECLDQQTSRQYSVNSFADRTSPRYQSPPKIEKLVMISKFKNSVGEKLVMPQVVFAITRLFLAFVLCLASSAQDIQPKLPRVDAARSVTDARVQREAVQLLNQEYVFPQFVIGGEWASTIKLTNRGTRPLASIPVFPVDNTGNPLRATFQLSDGRTITDSSFTVSLQVGGLIEATLLGARDT